MTGIAGLLTLGALAALANLIGGLLIASSGAYRREAKLLKYLIALGAGFMLAAGRSSKKAAAAALAIGAATFAGVVGVALMKARVANSVAYALPFSAGVTLYVAASDLIPEVNRSEEKNPIVSVIVFAGVALFYLLHRLIPR